MPKRLPDPGALCKICGLAVEVYSYSRTRCTMCVGVKWCTSSRPKISGVCPYCGAWATLTRDHVVPKKLGGSRGDENILSVCGPCNASKGCLTLEHWLSLLPPDAPQQYLVRLLLSMRIEDITAK